MTSSKGAPGAQAGRSIARRSVLVGAAGAALFQGAAEARTTPPSLVRRGRLFVAATVNGHATTALLDTAAELTLVDRDFAARIGLAGAGAAQAQGSGAGTLSAQFAEGVAIEAAGLAHPNATVALIDLSDVSRRLNGAPIDLILGRDYFDLARFEVDLPRRVFRPLAANGAAPRGQPFMLTEEFGTLTMPVRAEGRDAHGVIDLGNGTLPMVSRAFAQRLGALTDGRPLGEDRGGGLGGEASRQTFHLSELAVAGRTFRNVLVAIDAGKNASDLNLGTSILRRFHMTLAFADKTIWLAPI